MKIFLDENLDEQLPEFIHEHEALHIKALGWQGTTNGQLLLKVHEAGFDVFLTADKNMPYQQNLQGRSFCLIVLDIHPNVLENQAACIDLLNTCLMNAQPGEVHLIEGPHPKRGQ